MINCCDFCETQNDSDAHWARLRARYGKTASGEVIEPPAGWRLLPFGEEVPQEHREFLQGVGWARPRRCRSTMTPITARPYGHALVYAVPLEQSSGVGA